MREKRAVPLLDRFRLLCALLVVCIHTGPLSDLAPAADFWLTRVLARVSVPFFFMVTGHFLARGGWRGLGRFFRRTLALYLAATLLYLPLNWYADGWDPALWGKKLLTDGTFYHLWYFPAVLLGVVTARALCRLGKAWALAGAGLLYLVGLGGDSWYGLAAGVPWLKPLYGGIFSVFAYTRNGLFFAPLFLLLGGTVPRLGRRTAGAGLVLSLALMTGEAFWLRGMGWQRHDSMYLALPAVMVFLFALLLGADGGRDRRSRDLAMLVYLLHPWCIVLVRAGAKLVGLEGLLIRSSLGHFAAVLLVSLLWAALLLRLRPMRPDPRGRAWREVNLSAVIHNARAIQSALSPGCRLMAVVKADAYGHGAVPIARALQSAGVDAFAVACLSEGVRLRRRGVRGKILVLGCTPPEQAPLLARYRLIQTVADEAHGLALSAQGTPVQVHLALDTGMRRLGIPAEDRAAIARMYALPGLRITGVFSHLCVADGSSPADAAYTQGQLERFYTAVRWMKACGCPPGDTHIQASYGIWNLPPQPCAYARAGIALYGVTSGGETVARALGLRPALSLRARVALVRTLEPGEGAGYGLAFTAARRTRLAVVTIGYADGLPRVLAERGGEVLLHGRRCPMVGRMCMDQLMVDVTAVPEAAPGDVVTLIGKDGGAAISAEDAAESCATITNELLSRLGSRLPLIYAGLR